MKLAISLLSITLAVGFIVAPAALAQDAAAVKLLEPKPLIAGHQVVPLFPPGHPALKALAGSDQEEKFNTNNGKVSAVTNIHNPSIELYLADPEKANGTSVVIAAGGGNNTCNVGSEGTDIAAWFNSLGASCFVHRYRLKPYGSATDALAETQRAMRMVRSRAAEWKIDPNKIGHIGFSAGGEQTARLAVTFDEGNPDATDPIEKVSSRPDWIVLVYPGWTPGTMNLERIPKNPPPTFLICPGTGDVFHAKQTVEFYNAFFEAGRTLKPKPLNIEMHIYGEGKHGGAISSRQGIPYGKWQLRLAEWATELKLLPEPKHE